MGKLNIGETYDDEAMIKFFGPIIYPRGMSPRTLWSTQASGEDNVLVGATCQGTCPGKFNNREDDYKLVGV